MQLQFFCPRWGSERLGWNEFIARVTAAGYDGIEYGVADAVTDRELDEIWSMASRQNTLLIAQHYDTNDADYGRHRDAYHAWLQRMRPYPVVKINSQTGKDFFSFEQNETLIGVAARFSADTGTTVVHETHRAKFSFAAHVTEQYLTRSPRLRIALDVSHWVNVAESYLQNQPSSVQLALERTDHIHARVGHPQGPQVPDPRAPEWQEALNVHLQWWDAVVAMKRAAHESSLTISPEFGPYPYMIQLPFTRQLVADQWEVNAWMMDLLRTRHHSSPRRNSERPSEMT